MGFHSSLIIIIALIIELTTVTTTFAHPGRLDKDGGHNVRKEFCYKSGKCLKPDTYHYHKFNAEKGIGLGHPQLLLSGGKNEKKKSFVRKLFSFLPGV